jgi:rsbT co-antagonist protein RsbR
MTTPSQPPSDPARAEPEAQTAALLDQDRAQSARAAEAQQSERRLQALMAQSSQLLWFAAKGGALTADSPSLRAFTGLHAEELRGGGLLQALHPRDWTGNQAAWTRAQETGQDLVIEQRIRRHDGVFRSFEVRLTPVPGEDGTVNEWASSAIDVTDRAPAEHDTGLGEERFQQTLDSAPIGMCIVGLDGLFIQVNRALGELLGYRAEELVKLRFQDITHPDDLEIDLALLARTINGEIPGYTLEKRYRHRAGAMIHAILHVALVRDRRGDPVHFISQILDVTDQKRAEAALRASEERFRLLTTRLPISVFQANLEGQFTFVNERWYELLGRRPEDSIPGGWRTAIHPADLPQVEAAWVAQTQHPQEIVLEYRLLTLGGELRWVRVNITPVRGEAGRVEAHLGVLMDIQDQKHVEELLRESLEQRAIIESQRVRLAELSTPLIPIRDDIVIMPLIGTLDPERAEQVLETLLAGISRARVRVAILDVTGVLTMDEQVASGLLRAAQAARLLGAQIILSGIRPEVARTLVETSADLSRIITCGTLQAGITIAMSSARASR